MRQVIFFVIFLCTLSYCKGQTYISLAPSLTNTAGTIAGKSNIAIELGRQWDVFSMGLDIGKTSMEKIHGPDTTGYLEIRPNLNVFQQGKFTNTFTAGIGYIFNARENLMTELTSGIEYAHNDKLHINIFFGQYFYSGRYSSSDVTFFGISGMWYFTSTHTGSLIKKKEKEQVTQ
jgi:hypothetical protein